MALESSAECRDIDEETPHEDSLEELKGEGQEKMRFFAVNERNKQQKQVGDHILVFKNPKGTLDYQRSHEQVNEGHINLRHDY